MSKIITGNLKGLAAREIKRLDRIVGRKMDPQELISNFAARELCELAESIGKKIAVLIDRNGSIKHLIVGDSTIFYLPDLGRFDRSANRLRGLRLVYADFNIKKDLKISNDVYTDLEKLKLDLVSVIAINSNDVKIKYAHIQPGTEDLFNSSLFSLGQLSLDFRDFIEDLEGELVFRASKKDQQVKNLALLVGVYETSEILAKNRMEELAGLVQAAGVKIAGQVIQRRAPDPRTLVGKGKLEEIVLLALKKDVELLIFDGELAPSQWRSITNATDLKVLDRSMLILDIFAGRATSSEGRAQVALAQLKYNLPRLTEKDSGLSRLTGGIGGRGPGETKLEISRRRSRDKIRQLEQQISNIQKQRQGLRINRKTSGVPQVSLVGYTNAGKSTLFNVLTNSGVYVADQLFATLDTTRRKLYLPELDLASYRDCNIVISDTVGFIRDLPNELINAFRATLEELNESDCLLHVIDASDPSHESQIKAVEKVISDLGLADLKSIYIYNKIDQLDSTEINFEKENTVAISAIKKQGLEELKKLITKILNEQETVSSDPKID